MKKIIIQDHESGVRKLVSESEGTEYRPLKSFEEAKQFLDSVAIFEGDYGGQIYIVCPVSTIKCSQVILLKLLTDIDKISWNDPEGANIYYERHKLGEGISGGMGGAQVIDGIWIHEELKHRSLEKQICAVIDGTKDILEYQG